MLHRFDFDERASGNLESLPKYWVPLPHPSFPNFVSATFDFQVGNAAPPSFHIAAAGRDAACIYRGPDTRVVPGIGYRIAGYVRPDRLEYARACISAVYLDDKGGVLVETQERSAFLRGSPGRAPHSEWLPIELYLPPAPTEARTIGLIAWVLQEATWETAARTRRTVDRVDVHGGAWFDDITVFALPRFDFGIVQESAAGVVPNRANVVADGARAKVLFSTSEHESADLAVDLSIRDAEQNERRRAHFPANEPNAKAELPVHDLPPGWYQAELEVSAAGSRIVARTLSFVRLAPLHGLRSRESGGSASTAGADARSRFSHSFGLELHDVRQLDPDTTRQLIRHQLAGAMTVPVWPGIGDDIDPTRQRRQRDLIQHLARDGYSLTALLSQPPREISEAYGGYTRSILDLLADDPSAWQPLLAAVAAPYSATFRAWQIGPSDAVHTAAHEQQESALHQLRAALDSYVLNPRLALAMPSTQAAIPPANIEHLRLRLDPRMSLAAIRQAVLEAVQLGHEQIQVLAPPLDRSDYARIPRLADWAKRLLVARHSGTDVVFVPQTWNADFSDRQRVAAPTEDYIIFRTLADVIGDALPGPQLALADGISGLSFYSGNQAVLAIWDERGGPKPRQLSLSCGEEAQAIDLWGTELPAAADGLGRRSVPLTSTPVLIFGANRALIDLAASMRLSPEIADAGDEQIAAQIQWTWSGDSTTTGLCDVQSPANWEATPRAFRFALSPEKPEAFPLVLRHAHNESIGEKEFVARCRTDDGVLIEIPLRIRLHFPSLEVRGAAMIEGHDLLLRQTVRNVGNELIHLRGSAAVPGRERQYRPFVNLLPGQVQAAEYRFTDAADLIGRRALLSIRELNDGTGMHSLELTIP